MAPEVGVKEHAHVADEEGLGDRDPVRVDAHEPVRRQRPERVELARERFREPHAEAPLDVREKNAEVAHERRDHVPTKAIVLTAAIGRIETVQAVQLGARGVVLKADASRQLFESIVAVASGNFWLGSQKLPDQEKALRKALADGGVESDDFDLSPREREILVALAEGLSNRDIAERFKLSEVTVKHHLNSIFDKCGVSNRLELALFALRHGLARL